MEGDAMLLFNGELLDKDQVHISYEDRGYYFGDGVYEVCRIYQGKLYEMAAHLDRLERSASSLKIELPFPRKKIAESLEQLLQADPVEEGILYVQFTRGVAPRVHTFPKDTTPTMLAYCKTMLRPVETMNQGITAITLEDIRWLRCDIKSLNLIPNTMAKQEAVSQGTGEAILHRDGTVTECSASNVMMIKNGVIYTHPANHLILPGITRTAVLKLAQQTGIVTIEEPFTLDELFAAEEVFITGTTVEITPIIQIDGKKVNAGQPGPLTRKLQKQFEQQILL